MVRSRSSGADGPLVDIDWNAVWRDRLQRRRRSAARHCADIWANIDNARRYWRAAAENNPEYYEHVIHGIQLQAHYRVLDIGAGPGNMAIPMARRVARLTAVEPAAGMADVLAEKCREHGVTNITCIRKRWEAVDPRIDLQGPYEVVSAAFSLAMPDLARAIRKMIRVACGRIYLFWFAGTTAWETLYRDLWPRLHGRPYFPGPKADVLFNLLYQMGIYPNLQVFPYRSVLRFGSMQEAMAEFAARLGATRAEQHGPLREFLETRLEADGGDLVMRHGATCIKFWWSVAGEE